MLDARFVRDNPEAVRAAMANRHCEWDIDAFLSLDEERRKLIGEVEALQAQRNEASKAIGALMKDGKRDEAEAAKEQVRLVNERINGLEAHLEAVEADARYLLMTAPNLPDASAPVGADEADNVEVKRWGTPPAFDFEPAAHWDLGPALGILDFERAVKLAGVALRPARRDGGEAQPRADQLHARHALRGRLSRVGAAGARQRRDADGHRPAAEVRGRPLQDHRRAST